MNDAPDDLERIAFSEENGPYQYIKLVASGKIDEMLLDALSDYIDRQRRRLTKDTTNDS